MAKTSPFHRNFLFANGRFENSVERFDTRSIIMSR